MSFTFVVWLTCSNAVLQFDIGHIAIVMQCCLLIDCSECSAPVSDVDMKQNIHSRMSYIIDI